MDLKGCSKGMHEKAYSGRMIQSNILFSLVRAAGFNPLITQEAGEVMTIIGLVAAGLGVTVLPASYQRLRIDRVVYRTLLDAEATSSIWLVQREDEQSPMAKAFFERVTRSVPRVAVGTWRTDEASGAR
jgi:DNA-binding transcriptional LysR family regulator